MGNNFFGPFTIVGTGIQTFSGVGFQGNEIEFFAGSKGGSSTTLDQKLIGSVDSSGFQQAKAWSRDNAGHFKYIEYTTKCISIWEYISGAWQEVVNASWYAWTADGFKLNVSAYNINYPIEARIRN